MEIGTYMNSHGAMFRSETEVWLESLPPQDFEPVRLARLAERVGFHSLWFPDHVTLPLKTTNVKVANPETGKRHYPEKPEMFDALTTMAAVAVTTERIKLATSVLISPYRPPLHDARQFATLDWLSNGRLIAGVGAGWAKEEFEALGLPYDRRGDMTDECIEVYKRAWTDDVVAFHGEFYDFANLSMDPKPLQKPWPPIVFGGPVHGRRPPGRATLRRLLPALRAPPGTTARDRSLPGRDSPRSGTRGPGPLRFHDDRGRGRAHHGRR